MLTITTWSTIGVIIVTSAFLCRELAKKKHRDKAFYFVVGGLIGPLGIIVVMTPLPTKTVEEREAGKKPLRVVERPECPSCHLKAYAGERQCRHCGHLLQAPWWERPRFFSNS
ncbi:MAG: HDOD domain-containing protein [Actinobacteria bacterium]|nr:HDOD domain-containing protein [Actinomycetota bacterium]MBU4386507.1 HDOD domain-containing protein [Actinomycetota bacterium]MCG2794526.1 HDOD domain-containing protein [Actinomycetes bacterium]